MRHDLHQPVWRALSLAVVFIAISTAFSDRISAAAFVVNSTADSVDVNHGDGSCQTASGECSLRAAIQEANALAGPDVIQLPRGTYVLGIAGPGEDSAASGDLDIFDSVSIAGDSVSETVVEANQIDRVFHVQGQASLSISGMTVRGGAAVAFFPPVSFPKEGGGFFVDAGAELLLKDAMITGNRGADGGGAVANLGRLNMEKTTITGNVGGVGLEGSGGGGIMNRGDVTISDSSVIKNAAKSGGGIDNSGNVDLRRTTVADNAALAFVGGGIENSGSLTVSESIITGNRAEPQFIDSGEGGGIYNVGQVQITNTTIGFNRAKVRGGGIDNDVGSILLSNVTLTENTAGSRGGAISNAAGGASPRAATLSLSNVTISKNTAGVSGGAMINGGGLNAGTASLTNVTLSGNSAPSGAGIRTEAGNTTNLNNTIVSGSAGDNCSGPIVSFGHNLSSDNQCYFPAAGEVMNSDAKLGPLQDNGGATQTHALLSGSPAIDAGDNTACAGTDQRGVVRPVDGNSDGVAICDIGAVEAAAGTTVATPAVTPAPTAAVLPGTGGPPSSPNATPPVIAAWAAAVSGLVGLWGLRRLSGPG